VLGVIHRTGGASEVKNVVNLAAIEWLINVDLLKFKSWVVTLVIEVGLPSRQKIVDGNYAVTFCEQRIAQMRAEETSSASDQSAQLIHELLAFLGGAPAASGRVSGTAAGLPTL